MHPFLILAMILLYFGALMLIAWYTSRNANSESYFLGNKASPWIIVAFGMIGDSLSGVTFISVPGAVGNVQFAYMQLVLGYLVGYFVISQVLLPLYYRMNLTSIYSYLGVRIGTYAQRTGAFFFLLSRLLGAAGRLFLAAGVIQFFVFDGLGIPFWLSVSIIIALMLLYTYKGGIKTLVWTDAFQSSFLLLAVILSVVVISRQLGLNAGEMVQAIRASDYSTVFFWDWQPRSFFLKQFLGGAFIAIAMTGLDQNMMQKNLSCRSLGEAQKNIQSFSVVLLFVNLFFLTLGALLWIYAERTGIQLPLNAAGKPNTDLLFPTLALKHLGMVAGLLFIVGLTAATFSSADSVLTTLTTSFYVDFLRYDQDTSLPERTKVQRRRAIHVGFAVLLWLVILLFERMNNRAIIDTILTLAGYTYGPLLGLFAFGIITKRAVSDTWVPIACIISPLLTWIIDSNSVSLLGGYQFGYELLLVNGLITYALLLLASKKKAEAPVLA